jgi:hypothetical protein
VLSAEWTNLTSAAISGIVALGVSWLALRSNRQTTSLALTGQRDHELERFLRTERLQIYSEAFRTARAALQESALANLDALTSVERQQPMTDGIVNVAVGEFAASRAQAEMVASNEVLSTLRRVDEEILDRAKLRALAAYSAEIEVTVDREMVLAAYSRMRSTNQELEQDFLDAIRQDLGVSSQ